MEFNMGVLSIVCIMLGVCLARVLIERNELRRKIAELAKKNVDLEKDALTGLLTRAPFQSRAYEEIRRSFRSGEPLAMVIADIDHFKNVNDTYGHPVGDVVLRKFAEVLIAETREVGDFVCRYGGEEFAILMSDTSSDDAALVAERLREAVSNAAIDKVGNVTASFGVQTYLHGLPTGFFELMRLGSDDVKQMVKEDANAILEWLVRGADQALYEAKRNGRNRVAVSTEDYLADSEEEEEVQFSDGRALAHAEKGGD